MAILIFIIGNISKNKIVGRLTLKFLLRCHNVLYRVISVCAIGYYGRHPKHRIIRYFDWFACNVSQNSKILDIGSNTGLLAVCLAEKVQKVTAVEMEKKFYSIAVKENNRNNIVYINEDVFHYLNNSSEIYDIVVMSNVLEHIANRNQLLKLINSRLNSNGKLLLRVPQYDRDWITPLKNELNIDWRTDPTHETEYTENLLCEEIRAAGFKVGNIEFRYAEIYMIAQK
jgi:2-polyprenyl-3-methyl-5-hydroxy-6-metoxy-1,4-benzoquinol methylase